MIRMSVRRGGSGEHQPPARAVRNPTDGRRDDRPADTAGEPSLAEMAEKGIDILSQNPEGYLLLIEAGRIDHASHESNAYRTLSDGVALNDAVKTVLRKVDLNETLIVVTGDHSHTLTIAGYAKRGNPILGISVGVDDEPLMSDDGQVYTTIGFANGPGGLQEMVKPPMLTMEEATDPDFVQRSLLYMPSETHGGEDLGSMRLGRGRICSAARWRKTTRSTLWITHPRSASGRRRRRRQGQDPPGRREIRWPGFRLLQRG